MLHNGGQYLGKEMKVGGGGSWRCPWCSINAEKYIKYIKSNMGDGGGP